LNDPYIYVIDLGANIAALSGLGTSAASQYTYDGIHPLCGWSSKLGGMVAYQVQQLSSGSFASISVQ
jgi:hypothetical protein